MATSEDYIIFVVEQISTDFPVRYRKMFGEYMVYVNNKPVLLVCDNTVYVKELDYIAEEMETAEVGIPYDGAKEHYILDIENPELVNVVIEKLGEVTPVPKPRKKKVKKRGYHIK